MPSPAQIHVFVHSCTLEETKTLLREAILVMPDADLIALLDEDDVLEDDIKEELSARWADEETDE